MVHQINDSGKQPNDSFPERHPSDRDYFPLILRSDAPRNGVLVVHADEETQYALQLGERAWRICGSHQDRMWLDAELDREDGLELVDRVRLRKERGVLNKAPPLFK
jgi:hypothetical protein